MSNPEDPDDADRARSGAPAGGDKAAARAPERDSAILLTRQELVCGASVDELIEQVADGYTAARTDHQTHCPHCQAALTEFTSVWAPVREAAAAPLPTPAELSAAVLEQVRRLVQDVWYTLELTDGGHIQIAARIVATLARDAARRVPGVRVALGRSSSGRLARLVERATLGHRHPHAAVGVLGRTAVVDLAVAVTYGDQIDAVARAVQTNVIHELREHIGLQQITVNVTVDDVLTDP